MSLVKKVMEQINRKTDPVVVQQLVAGAIEEIKNGVSQVKK